MAQLLDAAAWTGERLLVEYVRHGMRGLGLVQRPLGRKRWSTWIDGGIVVPIQRDQIVYQFPAGFVPSAGGMARSAAAATAAAAGVGPTTASAAFGWGPPPLGFFRRIEDETEAILQAARVRPRTLWAAFVNCMSGLDLRLAAQRLFGADSVMHEYAAMRFCLRHSSYFRVVGLNAVQCRSADEAARRVEDAAAARTDYVQRSAVLRQLGGVGRGAEGNSGGTLLPRSQVARVLPAGQTGDEAHVARLRGVLGALRDYALLPDMQEPVDEAVFERLLRPLGFGARPADALTALTLLGHVHPDVNPHRLRAVTMLQPHPPHAVADALRCAETQGRRAAHDGRRPSGPRGVSAVAAAPTAVHGLALCIDSASTTEVDDGLGLERDSGGRDWLLVHIANPARLVPLGSPLDAAARARAVTVYLPEGSVPMFPHELAAGPMSLRAGPEPSAALTFRVRLSDDGSIAEYRIEPTVLHRVRRLTYEQASERLAPGDASEAGAPIPLAGPHPAGLARSDAPDEAELTALLRRLHHWAAVRRRYRERAGCFTFDLPSVTLSIADDAVTAAPDPGDGPAQLLVSELMIVANECAALHTRTHALPSVYRVQRPPPAELVAQARALPPLQAALHLLPYMQAAQYSSEVAPHAGLALPAYSHASSPIRRYADLVVHRQLLAHIAGRPLPYDAAAVAAAAAHVDRVSRQAQALQRASERFWALLLVQLQATAAGREGEPRVWPALVLECVEVDEGLLGEGTDYYFLITVLLNEVGLRARLHSPRAFPLGSTVPVNISFVDPQSSLMVADLTI